MSERTIETMLSRIEHLERANRAMKFIAIGAVLACIALNAVPAVSSVFPHGPKRVDAESYNLVSPKGVLLASLNQTVNGGFLAFYDAKGNPEMTVGVGAPDPEPYHHPIGRRCDFRWQRLASQNRLESGRRANGVGRELGQRRQHRFRRVDL